jgi:hypothetical protein
MIGWHKRIRTRQTSAFALALAAFFITPQCLLPAANWTEPQGPDVIAVDQSKPGLVVREYVPAKSVVSLFLTSDGTVIKNANGTTPRWEYNNSTGAAGLTSTFDKLKHVTAVNGKKLTDIQQRTQYNPAGTLQAAAFDVGGAMFELGPWLFDEGYIFEPLVVPDFSSTTLSELCFGVRLEELAAENIFLSPGDVGSRYQIVSGLITSRISGSGPNAAQLQSYVFGTAELTANPTGGWAGALYTGEAELFGWHELETVPEPSILFTAILAVTLTALARRPLNLEIRTS